MMRLHYLLILPLLGAAPSAQGVSHAHAMQAMGFDQAKTTHHFYLFTDGGAIDVSVKDAADRKNLDAIRAHLPHVAEMFGAGNFAAPALVHQTDVPGVGVLAREKAHVAYRYRETPRGGRIDIVTTRAEALEAVHTFLKFQITDHKTGDPLKVTSRR